MDAFDKHELSEDITNINNKLAQIRSAAMVIQAKALELNATRQRWIEQVASDSYDQQDIDRLDSETEGVAELFQAVQTYLS